MGIRILFFFAIMMLDSVWAMDSEKTYLIKLILLSEHEENGLDTLSFQRKNMYLFAMANQLDRETRLLWLTRVSQKISGITQRYQCNSGALEVLEELINANKSTEVGKVQYEDNPYDYFYSQPIHIDKCNLLLAYKEKILRDIFPTSGVGKLMIYEMKEGKLRPILTKNIVHFD